MLGAGLPDSVQHHQSEGRPPICLDQPRASALPHSAVASERLPDLGWPVTPSTGCTCCIRLRFVHPMAAGRRDGYVVSPSYRQRRDKKSCRDNAPATPRELLGARTNGANSPASVRCVRRHAEYVVRRPAPRPGSERSASWQLRRGPESASSV
jgi:hypothetical protein